MARSIPPTDGATSLGFERLVFFSDAVFAIAITLLVLDLKSPLGSGGFALAPLIPKIAGFGLSFFVIGRYWLAHHGLFETVRGYDGRLLKTNLLFLASVAFLPFPTSIVIQAPPERGPVIFYILSLAFVGLLMVALVLVARRPALMRPGQSRGGTARLAINTFAAPLVFVSAAGVAAFSPRLALWLLLLLIPLGWACERVGVVVERRIDKDNPTRGPRPRPETGAKRRLPQPPPIERQ
jgi:uncharacterized membrane protein